MRYNIIYIWKGERFNVGPSFTAGEARKRLIELQHNGWQAWLEPVK